MTTTNNKKYPESYGKISIENYRVFKEENEFDFKPISFLVGPNSSGKSSLMKFLNSFTRSFYNSSKYNFAPISLSSNNVESPNHSIDFKSSRPDSEKPLIIKLESASLFSNLGLNYMLKYESLSNEKKSIDLSHFEIRRKDQLILSIKPQHNGRYLIKLSLKNLLNLGREYIPIYSDGPKFILHDAKFTIENQNNIFAIEQDILSNLYEGKLRDLENQFVENPTIKELDTDNFYYFALTYLSRNITYNEFGDYGIKGFVKFLVLGLYQEFIKQELEKIGFDGTVNLTEFGEFIIEVLSTELQNDFNTTIDKKIDFSQTPVFKREREKIFNINNTNLTTFDILLKSYINAHLSEFQNNRLLSNDNIDYWLDKFGIGKSLLISQIDAADDYFLIQIEKENGQFVNISDLGYGAGQVLSYILLPYYLNIPRSYTHGRIEFEGNKPYIVELENSQKQKISFNDMYDISGKLPTKNVYLEEPETNLHPNWQSKLAELIVFQMSIGIRFVIETHSEYLIRKIQNLIALKLCDKNDVVIYYFNSEMVKEEFGIETTKKITINSNGTLSESFGPGFFDEAGKLSLELLSINSISNN